MIKNSIIRILQNIKSQQFTSVHPLLGNQPL